MCPFSLILPVSYSGLSLCIRPQSMFISPSPRSNGPSVTKRINMRHSSLTLLTIARLLSASSGQITCYNRNGDSSTHDDTQVCKSLEGSASMCCGPLDVCLMNGLCKVPAAEGVTSSEATYWRDTCSSSSWPSVGCLDVCTVSSCLDQLCLSGCD